MSIEQTINDAWENRTALSPETADASIRDAVEQAISDLNAGRARVAEKRNGSWVTRLSQAS